MMKQKKKKKRIGNVQGYALLYGRSSRAIRIVNGEKVEKDEKRHRPPKIKSVAVKQQTKQAKQTPKKYRMSEETKRRLDNLQDPLDMMSRHARAQKYEAANSTERYEYGLSDW